MSADRIQELHERASELYLSGDYKGALAAWREVLVLEPADTQAVAGIRMASQLVEHDATAAGDASSAGEVEQDLDRGLKILDGIGASESLDFDEDGSLDRNALELEATTETEPSLIPEGWQSLGDESAFGLETDPLASPSEDTATMPGASAAASAAASELKRRVEDLLREAHAKADAGERDEALAILSRLSILDEQNSDAEDLRASLERAGASDHDKVENAIIEGVSAFESGHLDDAERYFHEALERSPGHREAQHYLEQIAERRTSAVDDLLSDSGGEAGPNDGAVQLATVAPPPPAKPARVEPVAPAPAAKPVRSAAASEPLAPPAVRRPRISLPSPKVMIVTGIGAIVVAGAAMFVPGMLRSQATAKTAAAPVVPHPKPKKKPGADKAAAAAPTLSPEERAKSIAASLALGQSRMASGDPAGAVLAFHDVLNLEPDNQIAKAGIAGAGEQYKASKAERDALDAIRMAYRDGEYTSGLRLAYRLPKTVSASRIDAIKITGWYNLSIVDLKAGDCKSAMAHLDEALQIAPSDADAKKLKEFATRCDGATKDRAFLNSVESLAFRPTPAS